MGGVFGLGGRKALPNAAGTLWRPRKRGFRPETVHEKRHGGLAIHHWKDGGKKQKKTDEFQAPRLGRQVSRRGHVSSSLLLLLFFPKKNKKRE